MLHVVILTWIVGHELQEEVLVPVWAPVELVAVGDGDLFASQYGSVGFCRHDLTKPIESRDTAFILIFMKKIAGAIHWSVE